MNNDPRELIRASRLSQSQYVIIAILVLIVGLEGFEIASAGFAAPGIASDWGIGKSELGLLLTGDLFGMVIGSLVLGSCSDIYGRRPVILGGTLLITLSSAMSALSTTVTVLLIARVLAGLAIGCLLSTTTAAVVEHANETSRDTCVTLLGLGYGLMIFAGGLALKYLFVSYSWHAAFWLATGLGALVFLLSYFLVPETVAFMCNHPRRTPVHKLNRVLTRFGQAPVTEVPAAEHAGKDKFNVLHLARDGYLLPGLVLSAAYVAFAFSLYYMLKWFVKIVVDMGFTSSEASGAMMWFGIGGVIGSIAIAIMVRYLNVKWLAYISLACTGITICMLGYIPAGHIGVFAVFGFFVGIFTKWGTLTLYVLCSRAFPNRYRGTGMGMMLGIGRGGSVLSVAAVGLLLDLGFSVSAVSVVMGAGALLSCFLVIFIKTHYREEAVA